MLDHSRRVLGIIRPTAETIGNLTESRHIGVLATEGTIKSQSYSMEIRKLFPDIHVSGVACPLWAAIVEAGEADSPGADYFVQKRVGNLLRKDPLIDAIILGCTHYPLLLNKILKFTPRNVRIVPQGEYVAYSLKSYLQRHAHIAPMCTQGGTCRFLTTENPEKFVESASIFLHRDIQAERVTLE